MIKENTEPRDEQTTIIPSTSFVNHTVQQFDEMNRQVIGVYEHKAQSLETHLDPKERGLVNDLIGLPSLLYFRRSK